MAEEAEASAWREMRGEDSFGRADRGAPVTGHNSWIQSVSKVDRCAWISTIWSHMTWKIVLHLEFGIFGSGV